ncbi:hypothetical protein D3C74_314660 [compost metagenome]
MVFIVAAFQCGHSRHMLGFQHFMQDLGQCSGNIGRIMLIPDDQIKAGSATHRRDINDSLELVTQVGSQQMLQRMDCCRGQSVGIRLQEAQIIFLNGAAFLVLLRPCDPHIRGLYLRMIQLETFNFCHVFLFLSAFSYQTITMNKRSK